jgi:hypothetical protein
MFEGAKVFLKRNFIATFTGGLYFDRNRNIYINTIHFYFFFLFYAVPLLFIIVTQVFIFKKKLFGKENYIFEIIYPIVTFFIFLFIKLGKIILKNLKKKRKFIFSLLLQSP